MSHGEIVKQLGPYAKWADPLLVEMLAQADDGSVAKLHLSLALAGEDDGQVEYLYQQLLIAEAKSFPVIRDSLLPHKERLVERLWPELSDAKVDGTASQLQAAAALAAYVPQDPRWQKVRDRVAAQLAAVSPAFLGDWQQTRSRRRQPTIGLRHPVERLGVSPA